jgi:predicted metal-dependent hydrolase
MQPHPTHCDTRPASSLPPYSYVPGHEHPHPVTDPNGHLHGRSHRVPIPSETLARLPSEPASRSLALAALLAKNPGWLFALELFNGGFYWEAHEAWESFWHALGRTTPEARLAQGLIHLAAACVKIREGKPEGVKRHANRARELLGETGATRLGDAVTHPADALSLDPESLLGVLQELEHHRPECWHTSRTPVVRVLAAELRLAG